MNCECGGSFDEYGLCFECDAPRPWQEVLADMCTEEERAIRDPDLSNKFMVRAAKARGISVEEFRKIMNNINRPKEGK